MSEKRRLVVIVVETVEDIARFDKMLKDEHYLKACKPVGDYLRQVVTYDGEWRGLLAWGASSYALRDRDELIGWTAPLRSERQKLLVQNRRFLIPGKVREPNLASQMMGAAVKALPAQWVAAFGYSPVLAETFTDIERFEGSCYKAAGWLPVGLTKGYGRHRADFYRFHGKPKKLWLKPLGNLSMDEARGILCGPLPEACRVGGKSSASGLIPIPGATVYSLVQALQRVRDPRRNNRRFRCGTVLCIVAMALLSGSRAIAEIHRFGQRLRPKHRAKLGLPRNRDNAEKFDVPSYNVYYNLLTQLPLEDFAKVLTDWLQAGRGRLPSSLAMDGKMIRDIIGILSLSEHETGVPVVVAIQTEKKGDGEHCELEVGKRTLENQNHILEGALITGDSLHTQKPNAINVTDAGGQYLLQVRDNRPKLRALATAKAEATPFLPLKGRSQPRASA